LLGPPSRDGLDKVLEAAASKARAEARAEFERARGTARRWIHRLLGILQEQPLDETDFVSSSGYGYGDRGREAVERVFAKLMGAEKALVRPQLATGTQAIVASLKAHLRPGDVLLSITGPPYDTLLTVIGWPQQHPGSLVERGVRFQCADVVLPHGLDLVALERHLKQLRPKVVFIQRSPGYQFKRAATQEELARMIEVVKSAACQPLCIVDNCYGEFVGDREPPGMGADLACGSLIKNPGGGVVPTGGYIVGTTAAVEAAAREITGVGSEVGPTLGFSRLLLQGLFLAPQVVAEALAAAAFVSRLFHELGFDVLPRPGEPRNHIVQAVKLGTADWVKRFCRAVQRTGPVGSHLLPEPAPLPGYDDQVVMAAPGFIQGSSIELSADAPLRPPYVVYFQGSLCWYHAEMAALSAAREILSAPSAGTPQAGHERLPH